MIKIVFLCIGALTLMGCSASSVMKVNNSHNQYAPTNAIKPAADVFSVSFLAAGARGVQESREKDAYKKCFIIAMVSIQL